MILIYKHISEKQILNQLKSSSPLKTRYAKIYPRDATLKETTRKIAKRAVVFLGLELKANVEFFKESRSFSSKATFSRRIAFSCFSFWFSLLISDKVASNDDTYSFFFLRDRQADSRFLIILCWRFSALTYRTILFHYSHRLECAFNRLTSDVSCKMVVLTEFIGVARFMGLATVPLDWRGTLGIVSSIAGFPKLCCVSVANSSGVRTNGCPLPQTIRTHKETVVIWYDQKTYTSIRLCRGHVDRWRQDFNYNRSVSNRFRLNVWNWSPRILDSVCGSRQVNQLCSIRQLQVTCNHANFELRHFKYIHVIW